MCVSENLFFSLMLTMYKVNKETLLLLILLQCSCWPFSWRWTYTQYGEWSGLWGRPCASMCLFWDFIVSFFAGLIEMFSSCVFRQQRMLQGRMVTVTATVMTTTMTSALRLETLKLGLRSIRRFYSVSFEHSLFTRFLSRENTRWKHRQLDCLPEGVWAVFWGLIW